MPQENVRASHPRSARPRRRAHDLLAHLFVDHTHPLASRDALCTRVCEATVVTGFVMVTVTVLVDIEAIWMAVGGYTRAWPLER